MNNFVFLGAPGAGKGTMSAAICKDRNYLHISTGDLLRAEVAAGSDLGKQAKGFMDSGALVPDQLVADLLSHALGKKKAEATAGFIFDGYPRTLPQAELLQTALEQNGLSLSGVVLLDAPESLLLERLTGRRLCRQCGAIYHLLFGPPKKEGVCDKCGGALYQRSDDNETSVRQRLEAYHKQTQPLIAYYTERNLLFRVDSSEQAEANYRTLAAAVDAWLAS